MKYYQLQHLLSIANAGMLMTFFSCGQSMFIQCYSVALNKRLFSGPVHAHGRAASEVTSETGEERAG